MLSYGTGMVAKTNMGVNFSRTQEVKRSHF